MNILKQSQRFLAGGNSHSPRNGKKRKHIFLHLKTFETIKINILKQSQRFLA